MMRIFKVKNQNLFDKHQQMHGQTAAFLKIVNFLADNR